MEMPVAGSEQSNFDDHFEQVKMADYPSIGVYFSLFGLFFYTKTKTQVDSIGKNMIEFPALATIEVSNRKAPFDLELM